ncbi:MAG: IS200/IS605 family transposase [candidate division Zixibacteria bacterium]|nr:IS200/IS605 family transposase [candidate division Zixibacteria bacterium]
MKRREIRTLSHSFYDCKYHIVFTPKYRGKILHGHVAQELRRIIKLVCHWKGFEIIEGSICTDHIHLVIIIPPKHSVSYAMSIIKGKSSSWVKKKNKKYKELCNKGSLWARGYFVSTVGIDEEVIRRYVRHQSKHNQIQQELFKPT